VESPSSVLVRLTLWINEFWSLELEYDRYATFRLAENFAAVSVMQPTKYQTEDASSKVSYHGLRMTHQSFYLYNKNIRTGSF
jgi:hypothetical protein